MSAPAPRALAERDTNANAPHATPRKAASTAISLLSPQNENAVGNLPKQQVAPHYHDVRPDLNDLFRKATDAVSGDRVKRAQEVATAGTKRKSDALDAAEVRDKERELFMAALRDGRGPTALDDHQDSWDDDDDEDEYLYSPTITCNAVRKKIRDFIASGAMKVGEFRDAINVSSPAYSNFMKRTGTWDGEGCDAYIKAYSFFHKREMQGITIPKPSKKQKTAQSKVAEMKLIDVTDIELPGESSPRGVPVFETCDSMRKKLRAVLNGGVTQAALCRALTSAMPEGEKIHASNLSQFMGQKGPRGGNTAKAFYASYVYFEKQRVKEGKPKSKWREEMEEVHWPMGMDIEHNTNTRYIGSASRELVLDKYGALHSVPKY